MPVGPFRHNMLCLVYLENVMDNPLEALYRQLSLKLERQRAVVVATEEQVKELRKQLGLKE